jgi:hypothetical protein
MSKTKQSDPLQKPFEKTKHLFYCFVVARRFFVIFLVSIYPVFSLLNFSGSCDTSFSVASYSKPQIFLSQGFTNPRRQIALAAKFCTVSPKYLRIFSNELASCHFWRLEF